MKNLFNKEVLDSTKEILDNIQSELDKQYCDKNNILLSTDEMGMSGSDLISKSSMDAAFHILLK